MEGIEKQKYKAREIKNGRNRQKNLKEKERMKSKSEKGEKERTK